MSLRISSASESKSASDPCLKIRLASSPEPGLLVSVSVSASELQSESVLENGPMLENGPVLENELVLENVFVLENK
jgi:hypothetical protein